MLPVLTFQLLQTELLAYFVNVNGKLIVTATGKEVTKLSLIHI